MNCNIEERLKSILLNGTLQLDEPMKKHTSFSIGGPSDYFVMPSSKEEIQEVLRISHQYKVPLFVMGNGSNLLVSDQGIRGIVMQLGRNFQEITFEDEELLYVQAGALLSKVARAALDESLTGFEFAAGIPGSFGGAVAMNAGAYGGEMKDILVDADVLTQEGELLTLSAEELELSYRHSCVFEKNYILLGAHIRLKKGCQQDIKNRMDELARARKEKQPLEYPSAGSTFKRPEGYFAGKLIQDAGLKGYTVGGAMVSEKHAGFVVNHGGATADEVAFLIRQVQKKIKEQFGVQMEPEVRLIGFEKDEVDA